MLGSVLFSDLLSVMSRNKRKRENHEIRKREKQSLFFMFSDNLSENAEQMRRLQPFNIVLTSKKHCNNVIRQERSDFRIGTFGQINIYVSYLWCRCCALLWFRYRINVVPSLYSTRKGRLPQ